MLVPCKTRLIFDRAVLVGTNPGLEEESAAAQERQRAELEGELAAKQQEHEAALAAEQQRAVERANQALQRSRDQLGSAIQKPRLKHKQQTVLFETLQNNLRGRRLWIPPSSYSCSCATRHDNSILTSSTYLLLA